MGIRTGLALALVCLSTLGCGGGGGGSDGDAQSGGGITLSASRATPGQFLTIQNDAIAAGTPAEVTFRGPGGFTVSTVTGLTENGALRVAVPPFLDTATAAYTSGDVTVSVAGVDATASLHIDELPIPADMDPGEVTRSVIAFSRENLSFAAQKIQAWADENGADAAALLGAIEDRVAALQAMEAELAQGYLTARTDEGLVVLEGEDLETIDRLVAAHFMGIAAELGAGGAASRAVLPRSARASILTRQGWADILRTVKAQAIPGMQTLGAYVSVVCGVASFVPPVASVAGPVAIGSTAIVTLGAAAVSILADVGIDLIEGRDPDGYRALENAGNVVVGGIESIALTALGSVEWAGSKLSSLASLLNDTWEGFQSFRDLECATRSRRTAARAVGLSTTLEAFCQDTEPVPEPVVAFTSVPGTLDVDEPGTWSVSVGGGTPPYLVSFQWGDGTRDGWATGDASASGSHSYDAAGTYAVTVTITDGVGASAQVGASVEVAEDAPGACVDLAGTWTVTETATWVCTWSDDGSTNTSTDRLTATTTIDQVGCAFSVVGSNTTAPGTVSGTFVTLSVPFYLNDVESDLQATGSATGGTLALHGTGSIADGVQSCEVAVELVFTR